MTTVSIAAREGGAFLTGTQGLLRIAVPSWRRMGDGRPAQPVAQALSREEIQRLFQGELSVPSRRKAALTEGEERESSLSRQLRTALYPVPARFAH